MQLTFNFDHRNLDIAIRPGCIASCPLPTCLPTTCLPIWLPTCPLCLPPIYLMAMTTRPANEEVCSSDGVSPSGLTNGGDVSLPDGTEATPSDDTTEVPSSESTEHMPKAVQAPWMTGNGEAGNFVEIATRGGIIEYDAILKQRKLVFYPL